MFLTAIKDESLKYQVISNIALYGGLRKGELLGLAWDDIDFKASTIRVNKANQYLKDTGTFTKLPKNKTSIRTVSIPKSVLALLKKYQLWQNGEKKKCGDLWEDNNLLFTQWNGPPMSYDAPYQWFKKFIKRYNLKIQGDDTIPKKDKEKYMLPEISFHGLRHTSATLLLSKNTDIKTISSRLGHSQASTTLNIYSHNIKSADEKAASALEDLLDNKSNDSNLKQA